MDARNRPHQRSYNLPIFLFKHSRTISGLLVTGLHWKFIVSWLPTMIPQALFWDAAFQDSVPNPVSIANALGSQMYNRMFDHIKITCFNILTAHSIQRDTDSSIKLIHVSDLSSSRICLTFARQLLLSLPEEEKNLTVCYYHLCRFLTATKSLGPMIFCKRRGVGVEKDSTKYKL